MMKVIRDEDGLGLFMIPLFIDWNVRRCNVEGCLEKPSTIISQIAPNAPVSGWCEQHYQDFQTTGKFDGTLVFDDYDAFKDPATPTRRSVGMEVMKG